MSTSERTPGLPLSEPGVLPSPDAFSMAKEIERLANQFFAGAPGPAMELVSPAAGMAAIEEPRALVPPHLGPNAMHVGAGGASPAVALPPIPGFMHRPPLAAAPPPKESDLRSIPTQLTEQLGFPSVIEQASYRESGDAPYFLGLAGMPSPGAASALPGGMPTSPSAMPSLPGAMPTSPGALPTSPGAAAPSPAFGAPSAPSPAFGAPSAPADPSALGLTMNVPPAPVLPGASAGFEPTLTPYATPGTNAVRAPRKASGLFEPNAVRRDFPVLRERVHGKPLVWLDNAATTQKPQSVIDRISYFYEHENSNIHRAAHTLAARATDAYESARNKVAKFLNASSPKEIVFVRGATEGINLVAQSWGRRHVSAGDEIVITWLEHHANIVPWQQLCSEKGARLRVAPVDDSGQVILEEFEKLLGPRTRIVSITQVSNALGTIVPAQEMVAMARRHGARVLVDGAQAVSHMPVDVQALDCDFYTFSGHKVFGPTGIGAVFGKADVLDAMPPWQGGGNMIADVTFEKTAYQPAPARFEAGTGNIADAVGLGAAVDYVTELGLDNVRRYEHELLGYATERLSSVPGIRFIGTAKEKAGVISFVLDGTPTEQVGGLLDQEGIAVRSGHHCAQPILRRFGVEGSVRASLAPYNTREDIDALVAALHRLQVGRPRRVS